jgi:hypothetical protein
MVMTSQAIFHCEGLAVLTEGPYLAGQQPIPSSPQVNDGGLWNENGNETGSFSVGPGNETWTSCWNETFSVVREIENDFVTVTVCDLCPLTLPTSGGVGNCYETYCGTDFVSASCDFETFAEERHHNHSHTSNEPSLSSFHT